MVLHGELPEAFERIRAVHGIYAEEETGAGLTYARDERVRGWAKREGIGFREVPRNGVIRGLRDRDQRMPIWEERIRREELPPPERIPMSRDTRRACATTLLPTLGEIGLSPPAGPVQRLDEEAAGIVLESFLSRRGKGYAKGISAPELARHTGSRLSVHLAWGTCSLRQVIRRLDARVAELRADRQSGRGWLTPLKAFRSRLFWHDHFCQRLEREPEMEHQSLNRAFDSLPYKDRPDMEEQLWSGRTGFPMVDATVRALTTTGFANFRMRAMLVSFATYALHIDWRRLRDPMARIMADYLPGIHLSQLQMQAGVVGINTVRVYNPSKQLLDNDPQCQFVRRFVPELRRCSDAEIIACALQGVESPSHGASGRLAGIRDPLRPADYPEPIIDFRSATAEMKAAVYSRKRSTYGRSEAARVLEQHGSRRSARTRAS
jgi:deoxyribodipyrimidine photo-lyase